MAKRPLRVLHAPVHDAQVVFLDLARADLCVHRAQRLRRFGEDHDAAGHPVDAVAQRRGKARARPPLALLVEIRLRMGQQRMHLLALVRMADEARALVKQHDLRVLIENGELRMYLRVERVLALGRFKEAVLDVELHALPGGEDEILPRALSVDLHAPQAQEFANLPHARGGQRLLQKAGQPAAVPALIHDDALHVRSNRSLSTRMTPSSSLLGAMCLAMRLSAGCAFSIA